MKTWTTILLLQHKLYWIRYQKCALPLSNIDIVKLKACSSDKSWVRQFLLCYIDYDYVKDTRKGVE